MSRVGLVPQLLGMGTATSDGTALSGTALKLRFMPATLAAASKARFWDDALPHVLELAQRLDNLAPKQGGFGREWADALTAPTVERTQALPEDETEEATRHVSLVTGEIEARRTAVEALHPDWDPARVDDELALIEQDMTVALPQLSPPSGGITPSPA